MKRIVILCALLLVSVLPASAQRVFQGTVVDDESGFPLPAATLFLTDQGYGVTTNLDGQFELRLSSLPTELEIRHIGYHSQFLTLTLDTPTRMEIRLSPATYLLDEVVVSDEDPAYNIMRKVIEAKLVWQDTLSDYQAEAYTRFMLYRDLALVQTQETIANHYWRKGEGVRHLIRARRNRPRNAAPLRFATTQPVPNLYDDLIAWMGFNLVGPTHPNALNHYVFTLGGLRQQDDRVIYDIYFSPRDGAKTGMVGFVAVRDEDYVILEAGMRPHPDLVLPDPIKDWDTYFEQQFAPVKGDHWLPIQTTIEGSVSFGRLGVQYPQARYRQVARLTGHILNVAAPDSLFRSDNPLFVVPNVNAQEHLFRWNPGLIPMTPAELEAVTNMDHTMTVSRAFRPYGLLTNYAAINLHEEEQGAEVEERSHLLGGLYQPVRLHYNRVEGYYLGLEQAYQLGKGLQLEAAGGYGMAISKPEGKGALRYAFGDSDPQWYPHQGFVRAGYRHERVPQATSHAYNELANSVTTYLGWEDYFDYYQAEGWFAEAGMTLGRLGAEVTAGFESATHSSLSAHRIRGGWLFGDDQRDNPAITEGSLNALRLGLSIGESTPIAMRPGTNGFSIEAEFAPSQWNDTFDFITVRALGHATIKTFYAKRSWPTALNLRGVAGTMHGTLPLQRYALLDVSRSPITPYGTFRTLDGLPLKGKRYAALYWDHDFSTTLFELTQLWALARAGLGISVFGAHGRMWGEVDNRTNSHHELGVSLTHLFNFPLRIDAAHNLGTKRWSFGFGLTRRF